MSISQNNPALAPLIAALTLMTGCSWPRYANLDTDTADGWPAGATPVVEVSWSDGAPLTLAPGDAAVMAPGDGLQWSGMLLGAGVEPDADPVRDSDETCGVVSDFPPEERRGDYRGETLWALAAPATGTLCASVKVAGGAEVDLLLYDVTFCNIPRGPALDPDSGAALGYGEDGAAAWSAPVVAGAVWGVVLAAHSPEDAALVSDYDLALSLVGRDEDGGSGSCPDAPWEDR